MDITLGTRTLTATLADGTTQVFNLNNMVDVPAIRYPKYNTVPPAASSNPYETPTPTFTTNYKVVLHFNDNRWLEIIMGTVGNQGTWANTLTGANTAVAAISAAAVA